MNHSPIYIEAFDCLTPAGHGPRAMLESLFRGESHLHSVQGFPQGLLPPVIHEQLVSLRSEKALKDQDETTLMGVYLGRSLRISNPRDTGVISGSSRGPTQSLERAFEDFAKGERLRPSTSPTSTASSLSSTLARDLSLKGPNVTLSAACSTGLFTVIQGVASLKSELCEAMLVGGAEAANTPFTLNMLRAARVLAPDCEETYLCRPGATDREGMVLSEGAALLHLNAKPSQASQAEIVGWGAATEEGTLTGVSEDGDALARAIAKALHIANISPGSVDFIVGHGAGTMKGDEAELAAYRSIFGANALPPLVWHKWCGGHMLGASAALSVMLAVGHLKSRTLPPHPYLPQSHPMTDAKSLARSEIALITSMGFGGSACAVLVKNLS